jgi:predicted alpha/beta superfamily hydrolase
MREMRDTLRAAFSRVLPNRRRALRRGVVEHFPFASAILGNERQITVYLPPGYRDRQDRRYPVLYMMDGQNLFDPHRSFAGDTWRVSQTADEAIGERKVEPMIVVGVDHAGPARIDEFTPTRDERRNAGGRAEEFARMLLEELKPAIDAKYRTDAQNTAIAGSSLGGLVTLFLGLRYPDVFRRVAALSPSVWWNERAILAEVERFGGQPPRMWIDIGGREGAEALKDARALRDLLRARGWRDMSYFEDRRADHSERAWAKRFPAVLEYLFPPQPLSSTHAD